MTLAFSPCPNDTFIFDALVNKKIDTRGLDFEVALEDVETLNQWALQEKFDFTKISYAVLPLLLNNYQVLESGGALGKGVGPLLIMNSELRIKNDAKNIQHSTFNIQHYQIAIPGENTTAHLLFSLAYPHAINKIFMAFNEIEDYVVANKNALGVIIHENRFTYQQKGLFKVKDLGIFWEEKFQLPIPLGAIVAHKRIDKNLSLLVDELIKKSIEYAFEHYPFVADFVHQHAQEMEEEVMRKHIDLYVNNFSICLGNEGRKAVLKLLEVYQQKKSSNKINQQNVFLKS